MPALLRIHDAYPNDRRFAIVTFHDDSAKTFDTLDDKLKTVKDKYWGGRDLPFAVLLDSTGSTLRQFEINALPTSILLDPEGRLVARGDVLFDGDGKLLADGAEEILSMVLNGKLHVSPATGTLVGSRE